MHKRGFTIFFAVLVSSLALAVGLSIYDILVRELVLSQVAVQSQYAIYAADTGAECALYWDFEYGKVNASDQDGSAFATSTATTDVVPPANSHLNCDNPTGTQDLTNTWTLARTASAATTTFTIYLNGVVTNACAVVTVAKYIGSAGIPLVTTFNSNSSWTVPAGVTSVEVLAVGGGGGGGSRHGGGGGGGGVVYNSAFSVTPGTVMPITVGAGGQAGWYNGGVVNYGCQGAGGPGGNSTFGAITAKGGGGGKTYDACTYVAGGSGGGGGGQGSSQSGGTATAGQGNVGGIGNPSGPASGGGGGAGAVGGNYSGLNGGSGGSGIANSITGSSVMYGGGAGGGAEVGGGIGGSAGAGGGGHGGDNGGNTNQTAGTDGLGGGGGGTRSTATTEAGSVGGSGVVIVKYTPVSGTSQQATIVSRGYNTCSTNITKLERVLQVSY